MHNIKMLLLFIGFLVLSGCASHPCEKPVAGYALSGTNTAVVGIFLGKDGVPQETFKEVIVHPGQKVLYAGPDRFSIVFKNRKTPNGKVENESENGVVVVQIPLDIFEKKEFVDEFRKNNSLTFDYAIRVNGKELDPPIKVIPR